LRYLWNESPERHNEHVGERGRAGNPLTAQVCMRRSPPPRRLDRYREKRNFTRSPEPRGDDPGAAHPAGSLRFVVQKHAASHLHYDLRLEMGGVMKSWAVPRGPSRDPGVRRLAMKVEDHPVEYNDFEGTIPVGEYGGGTVMLWDRGSYLPDEIAANEDVERAVLGGYERGRLSLTFRGERLRGSYSLIRTATEEGGVRSRWLLVKRKDADAAPGGDITGEALTSVESGRTMDEIAAGEGGRRVWHSDRPRRASTPTPGPGVPPKPDFSSTLPMLARSGVRIPAGEGWTFEPKYDGIRILAFATAASVALITRNGLDKARQFPEIVKALSELSADLGTSLVLDGELVALEAGRIARFEGLQARMHLTDPLQIERHSRDSAAALIAFDVLVIGEEVKIELPWRERREALERILLPRVSEQIRLSETSPDRAALARRAEKEGWEGLMAKRVESRYRPGRRTPDWLKLKMENRQEFVVGGWTEPRGSRAFLGAILLGYYAADGGFVYAGHTGSGFDRQSLEAMHRKLKKLERKTPPFTARPRPNALAHWTTPRVVVEVKFNEWTSDGRLRQPVFLGFRDDRDPRQVVREPGASPEALEESDPDLASRGSEADTGVPPAVAPQGDRGAQDEGAEDTPAARKIRVISAQGAGELKLGRGVAIGLTSLDKVFYPGTAHTKADLLIYYARMADLILPWMKDRPLVLKRFPNGVEGESFYQQAAPDAVPEGVRVETLHLEGKEQRRFVGGHLATLLYTIQLGAISFDPWHSRVTDLDSADYTILDLDPGPGTPFGTVVKVAGRVREEMDAFGLGGALKTSGSRGLHIYLPLPSGTPLDAATLVARIVATRVARKHPKIATIERTTRKRPSGTVYVDFLQNILGKTVAGVYAVRAGVAPTVSTPLSWDELTPDLDPAVFTIDSVPARIGRRGDLWSAAMAHPNEFHRLLESGGKD